MESMSLFVMPAGLVAGGVLPSKRAFDGACEQDVTKRNRLPESAEQLRPVFHLHAISAAADAGAPFVQAPPAPSTFPPPSSASAAAAAPSVVAFRLLCPCARSGSVIGRGGDVIGRVRAATRARIKVDMPLTPSCPERVVHLSSASTVALSVDGPGDGSGEGRQQQQRCPAIDALLAVHDRILRGDAADHCDFDEFEERRRAANGGDVECSEGEERRRDQRQQEEEVEARLLIDSSQIGAVLGRRGAIISATRRSTGARLRVLPARELPACSAPGDELLRISGTARAVRAALRTVAEQLRANPPRGGGCGAVGAGVGVNGKAFLSPALPAMLPPQAHQAVALESMQEQRQLLQQPSRPAAALEAALAVLDDDEGEVGQRGRANDNGVDDEDEDASCGSPFMVSRRAGGAGEAVAASSTRSPFFSCPLAAADADAATATTPTAAVTTTTDVTFRLLVPSKAIGTVIGRGGDVARRLRAESGAWVKVHPVVAAADADAPSSSPPPAAEAQGHGGAGAERVVQLSSSCSCSSSCAASLSSTSSAAAAMSPLSSPMSSNGNEKNATTSSPLFRNAFSSAFSAAAAVPDSPSSVPSSPPSSSSSRCPAVAALLACVRLVLADGGGVGGGGAGARQNRVRLLVERQDLRSLFDAAPFSRAPEPGSVASEIAARTGATFSAAPALGRADSAAADEGEDPLRLPSTSPPLATATPGDVVLTISGAAAGPVEAATKAVAAALVRWKLEGAAARRAAPFAGAAGDASRLARGCATPRSSPCQQQHASPSRLGPWRSPPVEEQRQRQPRYDLWESDGACVPRETSSAAAAAPLPRFVSTVLRLDRKQAAAALGNAGANLAAISAASGSHLRLVDGGGPFSDASSASAEDGAAVGLELSGAASAVEAARGMVAAFVLAGGARPLST